MGIRKGFYFNMNTCIGCGSCQVACKDEHKLKPGEFFRRAGMQTVETGKGERQVPFSLTCNHCEQPACALACPTGAMGHGEDGIILHDDETCIGCGRCYWACPYGQVSFSQTRGMTQKCDTCLDRRRHGLTTACVAACPTSSLRFEDLDESWGQTLDMPFLPPPKITLPSTRIRKAKVLEENENE